MSVYYKVMRKKIFAVLTDIHSNIASLLKAVSIIQAHPHVDQIICLGDYFALGPAPVETLKVLQSLENCIFIRGNHDRYHIERIWEAEIPSLEGMDPYDPICQGIVANEKWTADQLGFQGRKFVKNTHVSHREIVGDTLIEFTHAWYQRDEIAPSINELINWRDHIKEANKDLKQFIFVHGHIHKPRFEEIENIKVLCQGATGLPFDNDQRGSVAFLTVGDEFKWDVARYEYDVNEMIKSYEELKPPFYENLQTTLIKASIENDE